MQEFCPFFLQIVDTIGTVDDLIEKNEEIITKLKDIIRIKYRTSNFLTTNSTLGECFNITIGKTPPTRENKWFSNKNEDFKWLSIKDMKNDDDYIFTTSKFLTKTAVDKFKIPILNEGDVVLSFKLTVGRLGIIANEMVTNEAIACFKVDDELRYYLYCYLNECNFLSDGENTSSIGQALNSRILKKFYFKNPDNKCLTEFNKVMTPLFKKLYNLRMANNNLSHLKQLLLKKYFG